VSPWCATLVRRKHISEGIPGTAGQRISSLSRRDWRAAAVTEFTQKDIALVDLVREAQTAAAVAEHQLHEGTNP
jgi:hypothetical protein